MAVEIKICCISSLNEAVMAVEVGAHILGLVGDMPSGPGIISDELAAEIAAQTPDHIETFLLTSQTSSSGIIAHHQRIKTTAIQIVDEIVVGSHAEIKQALPTIKLVQVIHVQDEQSVAQAIEVAAHVDALLLDSGNPNLSVKELGGTGRTHDWRLSQLIVESVDVPVYLAGGLNAENVRAAINQVEPKGIDLCSSVRTHGMLDKAQLEQLIDAAQNENNGQFHAGHVGLNNESIIG